ncbi:MAG: hypothetical protein OXT09_34350, partial [Myxococcales bacterium]|nr:hypothetical protein [Myxococcales bacterium]
VTDPGVASPPAGAAGRTAMGLPHSSPPKRSGDSDAVVAPRPVEAAQDGGGGDSTASVGPTSDKPTPGPNLGAAGRTMLGMPNVEELKQATAAQAKEAKADGGVPKGTVMGIAPGDAPAPQSAASTPEPGPGGTKPQLENTVVGFDTADLPPEVRAAIERGQGGAERGDVEDADTSAPLPRKTAAGDSRGRTMLGVGMGDAKEPAAPSATTLRTSVTEPITPVKRSMAPTILVIVLLVLAAAGAFFALRNGGGARSAVEASVVREGAVEYMQFTVTGAAPGAKLRFGGQEKVLEAGQTRFRLSADSLSVGKNAVLVEVVGPNGSVSSERITLELQHRVTLDTSPLRAGRTAVDVVVAAMPGSKVMLDGKPLDLDLQGRGMRTDPLDPSAAAEDGSLEHVVEYRVEPPTGEAQVGELRTRIPVASMQIDRPGQAVVTDEDSIEIAGAVGRDTQVSIDGHAVAVQGGRFLHRFKLGHEGVHQARVMATSDGRAPKLVSVRVERVANLARAAAGFAADASLTYAKISQNPEIYRGQKAAFDGRVYHVGVEKGRSVLQMLARDCPDGLRCPLWVTYPAATEFTTNSWVRALGVLAGEQQFRAENDEIRTVPKLEATFLLPAEP